MFSSAHYDIIQVMNDDFNRPDPILDDQLWWGTNAVDNANKAANRRANEDVPLQTVNGRSATRRFWTIWFLVVTFIIANIFAKTLF